ncbi:L,D-transpeptidase [Pseudomonadota bacterium]|nr:L,D-transpeptidase [Pseudomonadota bacterium]
MSSNKDKSFITIDISNQNLTLSSQHLTRNYLISTSKKGVGQENNSGKTPLGKHYIYKKIGQYMPVNSIFIGREFNFQVYNETLGDRDIDWILTRILWLAGAEDGKNAGGKVDTKNRYIYIHGTPYEDELGKPASSGCIRMANQDVIELFNYAQIRTQVNIVR